MGTMIAFLLLGIAFAVLLAVHLRQRVRMRRLTEEAESFLIGTGDALRYSVREDAVAPLHNALTETQNRLLLAKDRQAEECRRTSNLIADISHQLKTPLASLRLYCEMDNSVHLPQQVDQIERMERLICSLLHLERLCADGYTFSFADHAVAQIVHTAWAGLSSVHPQCRMELTGNVTLHCDEKWLGEAFSNLLKNACEHMPEGGTIRVNMETTETTFFCTVTDEGGGASQKDLPHLFERFYRAEGSPAAGTGIGLSIVREILWRHHGSISAENVAGSPGGLKMTLSIPLLNLNRA